MSTLYIWRKGLTPYHIKPFNLKQLRLKQNKGIYDNFIVADTMWPSIRKAENIERNKEITGYQYFLLSSNDFFKKKIPKLDRIKHVFIKG